MAMEAGVGCDMKHERRLDVIGDFQRHDTAFGRNDLDKNRSRKLDRPRLECWLLFNRTWMLRKVHGRSKIFVLVFLHHE